MKDISNFETTWQIIDKLQHSKPQTITLLNFLRDKVNALSDRFIGDCEITNEIDLIREKIESIRKRIIADHQLIEDEIYKRSQEEN